MRRFNRVVMKSSARSERAATEAQRGPQNSLIASPIFPPPHSGGERKRRVIHWAPSLHSRTSSNSVLPPRLIPYWKRTPTWGKTGWRHSCISTPLIKTQALPFSSVTATLMPSILNNKTSRLIHKRWLALSYSLLKIFITVLAVVCVCVCEEVMGNTGIAPTVLVVNKCHECWV